MATTDMPEQQTLVPTIAERTDSCFKSFQHCLNEAATIHSRELSLVEDQLARFSLWSSNIRVFAAGRGALDYRLREAPDVQDAVVGVLEALDYLVQDCSRIINSLGPGTSESVLAAVDESLDRSLQRISNEISLLHRFSNTIRRASKETQSYKAAKTFMIKDDEGNNAEPFLLKLFSNHVRDRFPGASDEIRQRLASTMLMRRKRVLYSRSRYGKSIVRTQKVPSQPQARPTIQLFKEPANRGVVTRVPQITAQSVAQTATTLSPENFQRASSPSVVSVSKTVALNHHEEVRFPPAPCGWLKRKYNKRKKEREKEYKNALELLAQRTESSNSQGPPLSEMIQAKEAIYQKVLADDWNECLRSTPEISCPYCFCALPVEDVVDEKKWSLHVISDLDPYVCMFQECDSPENVYSHSNTWLKHMEEHVRRWRCTSKSHSEFICSTRDEYLSHMKATHTGKFTDAQLEVLADRNGRIFGPMFKSCPLCGIEEVEGSIEHHLVGHMRFLAIKSLPSYEEDTAGLYETDSQEDSATMSRSGTRSTIRNDPGKHTEWGVDQLEAAGALDLNSAEPVRLVSQLDERSHIPNAFGPRLGTPPGIRPWVADRDPACAMCHTPATHNCDCEAKFMEAAITRREYRMLQSARDRVRLWVQDHAESDVQEHFGSFLDRSTASSPEEQVPLSQQAVNEDQQEAIHPYAEALEYYSRMMNHNRPYEKYVLE
ncbi:hypothetical protein F5Y12DRAFT_180747 [Xylaria sp. FL1777]|nr:hypothetical protein F5Y12DRAFT_180747 [Xylaria sp. FL1777]